jgi:phosphatidylglycerol:prolipoprotein diacylglycerol transferase
MANEFGMRFPAETPANIVMSVFPTQLYEVVLGFLMFVVLWRMRDHKHAQGWLFGVYMVLAGVERFVIEFYRAKDDRLLFGLTYAQGIAIAIAVGGVFLMMARSRVGPGRAGIYASDSLALPSVS